MCQANLRRDRLRLYWRNPKTRQPFGTLGEVDRWARASGRRLLFATNAGIYTETLRPLGLYVEGGKRYVPLNTRNGYGNFYMKPNGVFAFGSGPARIVETSRYRNRPDHPAFATQSGPLLVQNGRIHPAFRKDSDNRLIRSGVGVVSDQKVVFAISNGPVNFYDFATLFRDRLHCKNALYLDGSVSQLYCPALHRREAGQSFGAMFGILSR